MSGSGNDFVFLDGRDVGDLERWTRERIAELCKRRTGIGADGLVILQPVRDAGGTSADFIVRFNYFNADGGRSDMCGNAALCATRLAARLELGPSDRMTLRTDVGDFKTRCLPGAGERAEIHLADVHSPARPDIPLDSGESAIVQYLVGIPHLVVVVKDVDAPAADPMVRGRFLRSHPAVGPSGANANFVAKTTDGSWRYRTFERGVEAETLACGTGAVAVAAALRHLQLANEREVQLVTTSGRLLTVRGESGSDGALAQPVLAGEGRLVYIGELAE